jgi:MSHA biogenesis protein MshK
MDVDMSTARHATAAVRRWPPALVLNFALSLLLSLAPVLAPAQNPAPAPAPASSQTLPDPTRPPPEAMRALGGNAVVAAPPVNGGRPQLQSVLTGSRGRQVAVIDGQTVRRGDKFNGAVLTKVDKNSVVLRRGAKVEVLTLLPAEQADARPATAR